ncbi:MAG: glucose-1-phosphate cytidylyltransferase [Turneriella sp.]
MKIVILAGGLGSRISEETETKPKPMVEIGGMPILWHIMKIYSHYGFHEFIICLGYKGYVIKEFFANYFLHTSDITLDMATNSMQVHRQNGDPWKVTLVDTGENTMTGGRIRNVQRYIGDEEFCLTYGDGVGNIDIPQLLKFHKSHGRFATLTAVRPPGRFGALQLEKNEIKSFREKPEGDGSWISGGFFVLSPKVFEYISDEQTVWERKPLESLASEGQLMAYFHDGFWQPMDTLRDKIFLHELWTAGKAPWKMWNS